MLKHIARAQKRGKSYERIADDLNMDRNLTKSGGRWYPATVRSVWLTARKREAMQVGSQKPAPLLKPRRQRAA